MALAAVMLALALPLKVYIGQRNAISRLEQQTKAQQQRVQALRDQQQRWQDPAYVATQARRRLHFVMPGETAYVVLGGGAAQPAGTGDDLVAEQQSARAPWFSDLWNSVRVAGTAPTRVPSPAHRGSR